VTNLFSEILIISREIQGPHVSGMTHHVIVERQTRWPPSDVPRGINGGHISVLTLVTPLCVIVVTCKRKNILEYVRLNTP